MIKFPYLKNSRLGEDLFLQNGRLGQTQSNASSFVLSLFTQDSRYKFLNDVFDCVFFLFKMGSGVFVATLNELTGVFGHLTGFVSNL